MKENMKKALSLLLASAMLLSFAACSNETTAENNSTESTQTETTQTETTQTGTETPAEEDYNGKLVSKGMMELEYAELFSVELFEGGYKLVSAGTNEAKLLVVPEGMDVPADLDADVQILQQPLDRVYMASTGLVSLIDAMNGLDYVKLVATDKDAWYLDNVVSRLEDGSLVYSGAYSEPDYELMTANDIQLHVVTTMVEKSPEVVEKFTELKIPTIIENSSKEGSALARMEWIKLFGALFNMEEEANAFFEEQVALVEGATASEAYGKTVAMGYITTSDKYYSNNGGDYLPAMIEQAGGTYILADMEPEKSGNTSMTFEEWYAANKDADYLFYVNRAVEFHSIQDMIDHNPLLADFKSVQEGNVWVTSPDFIQSTAALACITDDMHTILSADSNDVTTDHLIKIS